MRFFDDDPSAPYIGDRCSKGASVDGVVGHSQQLVQPSVRRLPWIQGSFVGREDAPSLGYKGASYDGAGGCTVVRRALTEGRRCRRMHRRTESSYGGDLPRGDVNFGGFLLLSDGSLGG